MTEDTRDGLVGQSRDADQIDGNELSVETAIKGHLTGCVN